MVVSQNLKYVRSGIFKGADCDFKIVFCQETQMSQIIPQETIENKIFLIRGKKVMLDSDLWKYGTE